MTLAQVSNLREQYYGNGVLKVFQYHSKLYYDTDLSVWVDNVAQTMAADYTVNVTTGDVTFVVAPPNLSVVTLLRSVPYSQTTNLSNTGPLDVEAIETAVDVVAAQVQQLVEQSGRVMALNPSAPSGTGLAVPSPAANNFLGWNGTGTALENKLLAPSSVPISGLAGNAGKSVNVDEAETGLNTVGYPTLFGPTEPTVKREGQLWYDTVGNGLWHYVNGTGTKIRIAPRVATGRIGYLSILTSTANVGYLFTDLDVEGWTVSDTGSNISNSISGLGGVDTGVIEPSTLYYIWIVLNVTDETAPLIGGIISKSATAPTMPTGYTKKRLIGIVYTAPSLAFETFTQQMDDISVTTPITILTVGASTTYTSIASNPRLPALVRRVTYNALAAAALTLYLAEYSGVTPYGETAQYIPGAFNTSGNTMYGLGKMYKVSASNVTINVTGYKLRI